ncbi:MAG: T9SS type A sorting domain-containing protein [Saprospiraceae bacterium]
MMRNYLLILLFMCCTMTITYGQVVVLEDFENGAALPWNGSFGDGVFTVVENPAIADTLNDPLMINRSDSCGSYMKEEGKSFSLLIAVMDTPMDLTTMNKFKIQVNAPVASSFLFKLEGTGEAMEIRKNIAVTNKWIEYTFDFSAAASFTTINKIIIFFDPGNGPSSDTYLFDNITVEAADECAGTVPDPSIFDDFECQRNTTYGNPGYLDIVPVDNPDPSGINTSAKVGKYTDTGGSFHALVMNNGGPIDLNTKNVVKLKVWAPVAGRLLVKLEAGGSPAIERDAQVETLNTWVEYSIDFSDQAGASHNSLVVFFNAGQTPGANDVYYVDDIRWEEAPSGASIEDFEGGAKLFWEPLSGNNALHGTFSVITNPDQSGVNTTADIGSYTKGTSNFSTLTGLLLNGLDLSTFSQLNLQVWAPAGATEVTMQLQSPTQGTKEVTRAITATETWIDLNFNFDEFSTITDFQQVNLLFDPGTPSSNTYYFDNLSQGTGTVDPCEGVEPVANLIDDFACQRNVPITGGANRLEVVNNPVPGGLKPDPLDKVGKYTDPMDQFSALVFNYGEKIDLSINNQLAIKIWSPKIVPLGFKLEGGSSAAVEKVVDVTATEGWVEYVVDFSDQAMEDHQRVVIFFNFAQVSDVEDVYYVDDVAWRRLPLDGCIADFENPDFSPTTWGYFANGSGDGTEFAILPNPDKSGINTSDNVGFFFESSDATQNFAGMFTDPAAPMTLPIDNKTVRMKVWMDAAARIAVKLERGINTPNSGDVFAEYTTPGQWQELTWDYTAVLEDKALHQRLTLIFNFDAVPSEDKTYYFDDIVIGNETCNLVGLFTPIKVEQLNISPNPAIDQLWVNNTQDASFFIIHDMMGRPLGSTQINGQEKVQLDISTLGQGIYLLTAYNRKGELIANARFVKQ